MKLPDREPDYSTQETATKVWYGEYVAQIATKNGQLITAVVVSSIDSKELSIHVCEKIASVSFFGPAEGDVIEFADRIKDHHKRWLLETALMEACGSH